MADGFRPTQAEEPVMQPDRRNFMLSLAGILTGALTAPATSLAAPNTELPLIRLNLPGPGSLSFLPLELITSLGFDREMGARLLLRYHPSGIRALEDMLVGNADFAAGGFPTLPVMYAKGKDVVAIAPLSGPRHTFHLMVRKDLARQITRVEHLKGHTIAISTGSPNSKTYMQMLAEVMLTAHGIGAHQLRWLPSGQNWESISGAFISKAADAVLCEQPFPSRLSRSGLGVSLVDFGDPRIQARLPGIEAQRSAITVSRKLLETPEGQQKADQMVRILRRTLVWLQATPPEAVAQTSSSLSKEAREEVVLMLNSFPDIYSPDARFDRAQIAATDRFLQAALGDVKLMPAADFVIDRWAGSKP
jgi:NitT/TauT family transport system substrate-binding protein